MTPNGWQGLARGLAAALLCAYPVIAWIGLRQGSPRVVAGVLLGLGLPAAFLRLSKTRGPVLRHLRGLALIPVASLASLALATVLDERGFILVVPVAINALLLFTFGITLRSGSVPMIERFARLQTDTLDAEQRAWCRGWTWVWCAFFAANGLTAALLALFAPLSWWAFYNGLLAYVLIGALLALEWVWRHRRFADALEGRSK